MLRNFLNIATVLLLLFGVNYAAELAFMRHHGSQNFSLVEQRSVSEERMVGCRAEPNCNRFFIYRSIDGSCNNVNNPLWGSSVIPYIRYLPSQYEDGISVPRGEGRVPPLPTPRTVSINLSSAEEQFGLSSKATVMLVTWGQFLDHDLVFTPTTSVDQCCNDGIDFTIRHPDCLPLDVRGDAFYTQHNIRCLNFVRSFPVDGSCGLGKREQINANTAFIDGSQIYGSNENEAAELRSFIGGKLKIGPGQEPGTCPAVCPLTFLPVRQSNGNDEFFAGDGRAEEQPGLTSIHTLYLRLHNDIAEQFNRKHPGNSDEVLYQETRRVVTALLQKITYDEFLPVVLDSITMGFQNLNLRSAGSYETRYDASINPSAANVFATAIYRFGHSLVRNTFNLDAGVVQLSRSFNNHGRTLISGSFPSDFLKGVCLDSAERMDHFLVDALTNKLFAQGPTFAHGSDLFSRNIMRGRDHGLPPYVAWRNLCGLSPINSFSQLSTVMPVAAAQALQKSYQSVGDIDLFPAAISEFHEGDGLVGPTIDCILGKYFHDLKFGDRFWFESDRQPAPFTRSQLRSIADTRLSTLICAYTTTLSIQRRVMEPVDGQRNPIVPCSSILPFGVPNEISDLSSNTW